MYSIVRRYFKGESRVIRTGLTLKQAQRYCKHPDSSSRTCTTAAGIRRTKRVGAWFNSYTAE